MALTTDAFEKILADVASEASENLDARLDAVAAEYAPAGFKRMRKSLYSESGLGFWIVKHLARSQLATVQASYEKNSLSRLRYEILYLNQSISHIVPKARAEFHKPWSESSISNVNEWSNRLYKVGDKLHRVDGPAVEDGPPPYEWYWVNGHVLGNAVGPKRVDMIRAWDYSVRYDIGPAIANALVSKSLADFQKRLLLFITLVLFSANS